MGKNIEIFTDSSLYGDDIVERVKEFACSKCAILVYDANDAEKSTEMQLKVIAYGVTSMPAIVINGKLIPPEKLEKEKFIGVFHHLFHK